MKLNESPQNIYSLVFGCLLAVLLVSLFSSVFEETTWDWFFEKMALPFVLENELFTIVVQNMFCVWILHRVPRAPGGQWNHIFMITITIAWRWNFVPAPLWKFVTIWTNETGVTFSVLFNLSPPSSSVGFNFSHISFTNCRSATSDPGEPCKQHSGWFVGWTSVPHCGPQRWAGSVAVDMDLFRLSNAVYTGMTYLIIYLTLWLALPYLTYFRRLKLQKILVEKIKNILWAKNKLNHIWSFWSYLLCKSQISWHFVDLRAEKTRQIPLVILWYR